MTYNELEKFKGWTLKEVWPEIERTRWTQVPKWAIIGRYISLILFGALIGFSTGYFIF